MADILMIVDTAVITPVNRMPLIDDTDFKTIEAAVAYNAAGMDLRWNFVTAAGVQTSTAVTPTTAGVYDWTHLGDGIYSMEIPASGGASANNDTEGFGWWSGVVTGVLPFAGPIVQFSPANVVNSLVTGTDVLDVSVIQLLGTAWLTPGTAGTPDINAKLIGGTAQTGRDIGASVLLSTGTGTGQLDFTSGVVKSSLVQILGTALTETAGQIAAAFKKFFDKAAPTGTVNSLPDAVAGAASGVAIVGSAMALTAAYDAAKTAATQTSVDDLPTNAELATALGTADDAVLAAIAALNNLSQANIRTALGMASANLDTQIALLATAANLATVAGYLDTEIAAILEDTGTTLDAKINSILSLLDDARGEPGQGTPPVNPDMATKIDYLFKSWRNKKTNDGAENALYNDAGTVVDQKQATTEAAGTVTVGEWATGP